jgi:UDP-glucose 4-epimerase
VLLNTRLKTVFGYTPTYTSAEVFEIYRSARAQQRAEATRA